MKPRLEKNVKLLVVDVGSSHVKCVATDHKTINDAAMQALGRYEGGKMLFLGNWHDPVADEASA